MLSSYVHIYHHYHYTVQRYAIATLAIIGLRVRIAVAHARH
jgi:hypothetical protein